MENKRAIVVVEALSNGRFYIPEIEKRGYEPIVVLVPNENGDFPPTYEHFRETTVANYYQDIACYSPATIDETCRLLNGKDIAAVVSGSDYGTLWTDLLAERLGCPGNSTDDSASRFLKPAMQEALCKAGIRSIEGKTVSSLEEIIEFFNHTGGEKIVLKYKASAGSVGVHFCSSSDQIKEAYATMCSGTDFFGRNNDEILVQEYISGTEYIVNTVSCNGVHRITDIWVCDKVRIGAEGNAYNYYKVVTRPGIKHAGLVEYVYRTLDALGFVYGPCHGEYFIDDRGPVLVEVGARPMGGGFSPTLYTESLGHYLVDASLDSYLEPEAFEASKQAGYSPKKEYMIKYLIAPEEQSVGTLPILPLLKLMPSIREGNFVHCIEDSHIVKTIDLITAPAYLQLAHEEESVLLRDYELIRKLENCYFDCLLSPEERLAGTTCEGNVADEPTLFMEQVNDRKPILVIYDPGCTPSVKKDSCVFVSTEELLNHTEKYPRIVLSFGQVENVEKYFELVVRASELMLEDGEICFCKKTISCIPRGESYLDIIMEVMGMSVTIPVQGEMRLTSARKDVYLQDKD